MTENNGKVWLITGCSSGFGRSLTNAALKQGDRVIATARQPEQLQHFIEQYPDTAKTIALDVTDKNQVKTAVEFAKETFGRIDVLVNNAGYALVAALEETSDEQMRQNFETNLFGTVNTIQAVLPIMREQKAGVIVNMSAIAGFVNKVGFSIYGATKFAIEGVSEALRGEVGPLGIKVIMVEPGPFKTDFVNRSLVKVEPQIKDYAKTCGKFIRVLENMEGKQPGDPDKAAEAIIKAVESKKPPLRLVLGKYAYKTFRQKIKSLTMELDAWEETAANTDFES